MYNFVMVSMGRFVPRSLESFVRDFRRRGFRGWTPSCYRVATSVDRINRNLGVDRMDLCLVLVMGVLAVGGIFDG